MTLPLTPFDPVPGRCPGCGDWRSAPVALHLTETFLAFSDLFAAITVGAFREARIAMRDMRGAARDAIRAIECGRHDAPKESP